MVHESNRRDVKNESRLLHNPTYCCSVGSAELSDTGGNVRATKAAGAGMESAECGYGMGRLLPDEDRVALEGWACGLDTDPV